MNGLARRLGVALTPFPLVALAPARSLFRRGPDPPGWPKGVRKRVGWLD